MWSAKCHFVVVLKSEYFNNQVSTMTADAMAPAILRTSAVMVLAMQDMEDKQIVVFHGEGFKLLWCWRQNIPALWVSTMPADALTPKVTRASAGMVLAM